VRQAVAAALRECGCYRRRLFAAIEAGNAPVMCWVLLRLAGIVSLNKTDSR
jgi:hypothetical protein